GERGLETVLIQLVLKDTCAERNVIGMTWTNNLHSFNVSSFITETIERGVELLGAKKIKTGKYSIIFDGQTCSKIWKEFMHYFFANHYNADLNKLNTCVASDVLNITDYASFENSCSNFIYDNEGIIASDVEIIKNGNLKAYLHNQVTANKFGVFATGNGFKGLCTDNNMIKARNFVIFSNNKKNKLLKELENGVLITEINNSILNKADENGNIMLVCSGHLVKNGRTISPCKHISISINFFEFLKGISGIGNDYYFRYSTSGTIICPSLLVENVSVR
ncbi:MAG: metallopeptidase TldD-related protein, partial [Alkaliphilus sp.]